MIVPVERFYLCVDKAIPGGCAMLPLAGGGYIGTLEYERLARYARKLEALLLEHAVNYDDDKPWDETDWHDRVVEAVGHELPQEDAP